MNGMPPMPRRVKKLPLTEARKVRMRNRLSRSRGNGVLRGVQSVACQQRDGNRQQLQRSDARAERMFAEDFQHIRQQADAGTEQQKAGDIERMRVCFAVIGQMPVNQVQAQRGQWGC